MSVEAFDVRTPRTEAANSGQKGQQQQQQQKLRHKGGGCDVGKALRAAAWGWGTRIRVEKNVGQSSQPFATLKTRLHRTLGLVLLCAGSDATYVLSGVVPHLHGGELLEPDRAEVPQGRAFQPELLQSFQLARGYRCVSGRLLPNRVTMAKVGGWVVGVSGEVSHEKQGGGQGARDVSGPSRHVEGGNQ